MASRYRFSGLAVFAAALLAVGGHATRVEALTINWGTAVEAKAYAAAVLEVSTGEENSWDYQYGDDGGYYVPGVWGAGVWSDYGGAWANAEAYLGESEIGINGAANLEDSDGYCAAMALAGELVPFSLSGASISGGDNSGLNFSADLQQSAVMFQLAILDQDLNWLTGGSGVFTDSFSASIDLAQVYDFEAGQDYYLGGFIKGIAYSENGPGLVTDNSSRFDSRIQWGVAPVPEPGSWALLASGLVAVAGVPLFRRRRRS
jgi:hypothetical protein